MKNHARYIGILIVVAAMLAKGQDAKRMINNDFIRSTVTQIPQPRLMEHGDLEKAKKQNLLMWYTGHVIGFIQFGDFNRDFVLDAAVMIKSDDAKYEGELLVVIYSFDNVEHPQIVYFERFSTPVGVIAIESVPHFEYPLISLAFTFESDHGETILWDGEQYTILAPPPGEEW